MSFLEFRNVIINRIITASESLTTKAVNATSTPRQGIIEVLWGVFTHLILTQFRCTN